MKFGLFVLIVFAGAVSADHNSGTTAEEVNGLVKSLRQSLKTCGHSPTFKKFNKLLKSLGRVADDCITDVDNKKKFRLHINPTPANPLELKDEKGLVAFLVKQYPDPSEVNGILSCPLPIAADADQILFAIRDLGCGEVQNFISQLNSGSGYH